MVGPWPLALHHDYLQYIHHINLMQHGKKWGVTFPYPFNSIVLSALQNLNKMLHWYRLGVLQN